MSVLQLNRTMRPHGSVLRAMLLTGLAVAAILTGLLAMHVFSTGQTHHSPAVPAAHHAPLDADAAPAQTVPCDDDGCSTAADGMAFLGCVLALLAAAIILALHRAGSWRVPGALLHVRAGPVAIPAFPAPPDLTVLSISRT